MPCDPQQPADESGTECPSQLFGARGFDPQSLQQPQLILIVELDDPIIPPGVDRIPTLQHGCEPWLRPHEPCRRRDRVRKYVENAAAQPFGLDYPGRIDPGPAAAIEPDLRPGMGNGLPH